MGRLVTSLNSARLCISDNSGKVYTSPDMVDASMTILKAAGMAARRGRR